MPRDSAGNFHFNAQRAMAANKAGPKPGMATGAMATKEPGEEKSGMGHTELHDNGDGSFHTKSHDGEEADHPHIGHALMHIASKHSEGKHLHAHHDGMGVTTHHHSGDGSKVEGPHEHGSADEAGEHMKSVMGGESGDEASADGTGMEDDSHEMYGKLA